MSLCQLFETAPLTSDPHKWHCHRRLLNFGAYESLDFVAENLRNKHSYLALDEAILPSLL